MSVHPDDLLLEQALGSLPASARASLEAHLASCARCRRELEGLREALGLVSLSASSGALPAPPPGLLDDLLGSLGPVPSYAGFARRFARIFDLPEATSRQLLAGAVEARGWEPFRPGVELFHFTPGPAVQGPGVDAGLVRFAAGSTFPLHDHVGDEVQLVLSGGFVDSTTGGHLRPGDVLRMGPGTSHSFTMDEGEDCICAVLLVGGINIRE